MDLDEIETDYASIRALRKTATEFETYIANNKDMIPNYAERRRYGERVSTGFRRKTSLIFRIGNLFIGLPFVQLERER